MRGPRRTGIILCLSALMLSGCTAGLARQDLEARQTKAYQRFGYLVGRKYWVIRNETVEVYPDTNIGTRGVSMAGPLTIDSIADCYNSYCYFHVALANGSSGFIHIMPDLFDYTFQDHPWARPRGTAYPTFLNALKPAEAERRRQLEGAGIGMLREDVRASAWGEPLRISKVETYTRYREYWFYPNGNELEFDQLHLVGIKN